MILFERLATQFEDPPENPGLTPDSGDDYLVSLARTAKVHYLVSGDSHLTELSNPQPPVLTPREFVERVQI